jgi:hypothetical protein
MAHAYFRHLLEKTLSGIFTVSREGTLFPSQSSFLNGKIGYNSLAKDLTDSKALTIESTFTISTSDILFAWNLSSGWISFLSRQGTLTSIFWLPEDRRGDAFTAHGTTVVVGGSRGTMTILDLSVLVRDFL